MERAGFGVEIEAVEKNSGNGVFGGGEGSLKVGIDQGTARAVAGSKL